MSLNAPGSIVRFTSDHYPTLKSWYVARGRIAPPTDTLSDTGYVVDGRVIGFLYLTNSNMALVEGVIANPDSVPSLRRASLRKLVGLLVDKAVMLGYSNIFCLTDHPNIIEVARQFGGKASTNLTLLTLNTNKD